MGCLFHKGSQNVNGNEKSNVKVKEYSWDKRDAVNLKDYTIENIEDGDVWRLPGSINGQQFVIQNCKNTSIYIFDHINTVTIDDCINCRIMLSAVKGSVFLRDCKECVCVVACGQFRTRDCRKMDIFLCCATQPIIESSSNLHFGCYQLYYNELEGFQLIKLTLFQPECLLLLSKETQMQHADAERVFKTNSYNSVVQRGPVVGLQYSGPNCILSCQKVTQVNIHMNHCY
ncbi:Protein XRP2 [Blattella germanica]|nr:Protein XRP2 [Blattella germanica]